MPKDFNLWNILKKTIDNKTIDRSFFFNEREIWWCSVGLNIGVESDGKNENFERPILILKKFNSQMVWVVPLTGRPHNSKFYVKVSSESWACVTQLRTISTKRLLRKISMANEQDFAAVSNRIVNCIYPP